jgi:hypothetical protein
MTRLTDEQLEEVIKHCTGLSMALDGIHWPMMLIALQELQALRAKPMALSIEQWRQIRKALELSTAKYDNKGKSFSCDETWSALALMDEIEGKNDSL